MVAGIDAGDHRNGGARRLTVVACCTAVDGEEEGPFGPRNHPGARGGVGEDAERRTATNRAKLRRPVAVKKGSISGFPGRFLRPRWW